MAASTKNESSESTKKANNVDKVATTSLSPSNTFIQDFIDLRKGESNEEAASRSQVKNTSIVKAQISVKESETFALEEAVELAEKELHIATLNSGELVTDNNKYIKAMLSAQNDLTVAKKALRMHLEVIKFLKERLDYLV